MLYLYQSNRLENLAAMLAHSLKQQPHQHPMQPEEILVQSQGMRRYINQYLAEHDGIAANIRYRLPAGLSWQLIQQAFPNIPSLSPFSTEVMHWKLYDLLSNPDALQQPELSNVYQTLSSHLNKSNLTTYILAGSLADTFDQYLVYRPDWIKSWSQREMVGLGEDEAWQAELWHYLNQGPDKLHRVALWDNLLLNLSSLSLPDRYIVFGISTMPPMHFQLLSALSEFCDVWIFALNPCEEYWGNILEPSQLLKLGQTPDTDSVGHPLLASLGKQGRDFFDLLTESNISNTIHAYDSHPSLNDSCTPSLLAQIQHDLRQLTPPTYHSNLSLSDGSIILQSAHSPVRELQILKDNIHHLLAEHPEWQPHDIAVLTPNINRYSPYIDGIFNNDNGAGALPYSISDIKLSRHQPLMNALEQLLDLFESYFESEKVLNFISQPSVMERFELTEDDLSFLNETVKRLNIHWGLDHDMRSQHGSNNNLFTWEQGIDRILSGLILPNISQQNNGLWEDISPLSSNPNKWKPLSTLAHIIYLFKDHYNTWQKPTTVSQWLIRLNQLIHTFLQPTDEDQAALQSLEKSLNQWLLETQLAELDNPLPIDIVISHLKHYLTQENNAGFLRGGITFCGMVPMRSLPFKMIALIGLNDGDFPRQTAHSSFDLIARHPRKGDRARRDDDRYLFLEAIISARECLYISYIGHTITTNEPLAPSPLINELADTLATMTGKTTDQVLQHIQHHPLQNFSRLYFMPNSDLINTRQDYAASYNQPNSQRQSFFRMDDSAINESTSNLETAAPIDPQTFLNFWRNPVRSWLKQNLSWSTPYHSSPPTSEEPFFSEVDAKIYQQILQAHEEKAEESMLAKLYAQNYLPSGEIGQQNYSAQIEQISNIDPTIINSPSLPPIDINIDFENEKIAGSLYCLQESGHHLVACNKLNAPDTIQMMLIHLMLSIAIPDRFNGTHLIEWTKNTQVTYPPIPIQKAVFILRDWLNWYHIGQTQPLPFFPRTFIKTISNKSIHSKLKEYNHYLEIDEDLNARLLSDAYRIFYEDSVAAQVNDIEFNLVFGPEQFNDITRTENFKIIFFKLVISLYLAFYSNT